MDITNSKGSEREDMGGFQDLDMTPKPLRIGKRETRRDSESINTLQSLSDSSALPSTIPTRNSSISSNCTQRQVSLQNNSVQDSQRTTAATQDQNLPIAAATYISDCTRSSATSAKLKTQRSSLTRGITQMLDPTTEDKPAASRPGTAPKSTAIRAFSTGAVQEIYYPGRFDDEEPHLVPPSSRLTRKRAVTDARPIRGGNELVKHGHVLRRQSSFGKGFITRMMNNLGHRSHNTSVPIGKHGSDDSRSNVTFDRAALGQNFEATRPLGRISESSAETNTSNDSRFEAALAAFPTPPTSSGSSPRPHSGVPITQVTTQRHRRICTPEHASIMGAQLLVTAEHDDLTYEDGNNVLVAIDVKGAMNPLSAGQNVWSQHTGLDIVVIVDNS